MIHVREALADLLSDALDIDVHHQEAPQDAAYPLVIFHQQGGSPRWTLGGPPAERKVWTVKAVGFLSSEVEAIASTIDDTLNGATLDLEATTLDIRRVGDVNYGEPDEGKTYRHLGGMYAIWVKP